MADYADHTVLVTMDGVFVGKAAIQDSFVNALPAMFNLKLSATGVKVHATWFFAQGQVSPDPHAWDSGYVVDPVVTADGPSKAYRMWYAGDTGDWDQSVGFATSTDGVTSKKYFRSPVPVGSGR